MLKDYANDQINIDRVIKILLIYNNGEIDAGDTIIYAFETPEIKEKEAQAVKRLLDLLSAGQAGQYMALLHEFEFGETVDAIYAKAIDRVPPLLHNLHGDRHSWKDNSVPKERVLELNARIGKGSETLWSNLEKKLEKVAEDNFSVS